MDIVGSSQTFDHLLDLETSNAKYIELSPFYYQAYEGCWKK